MGARDAHQGIDGATRRFISFKAWKLALNPAFTPDEQEDLEQDLTLDLLQRLSRFDERRGSKSAFIRLVIERCIARLIEHRLAARRNPYRVAYSLDEEVEVDEDTTLVRSEEVGVEDLDESSRRVAQDHDLCVDLGKAIYRLPPDLQELAERLKVQSITEISNATGVPRSTLYGAIARIRAAFEQDGLREYVPTDDFSDAPVLSRWGRKMTGGEPCCMSIPSASSWTTSSRRKRSPSAGSRRSAGSTRRRYVA